MAFLIDGRLLATPNHSKPITFDESLPTIGNDYGVCVPCDNAKLRTTVNLASGSKDCSFTQAEMDEVLAAMSGPPGTLFGPILDQGMVSYTGFVTEFTYRPIEGSSAFFEGVSLTMRLI